VCVSVCACVSERECVERARERESVCVRETDERPTRQR